MVVITAQAVLMLAGGADAVPLEEWNRTYRLSEQLVTKRKQETEAILLQVPLPMAGKSYAWLRKVGEEQTGTATPAASPTETPTPTQTLRAVSNETQTVSPAEKIAGFEIILPIAILLAVNKIGRKKR